MKTINDDPEDFFDKGGWSFLDVNSASDEENEDEEDEDDEAYNPTDSEASAEEDESDFSEEDSAVSEDDDDSEGNSRLLNWVWKCFNFICFSQTVH